MIFKKDNYNLKKEKNKYARAGAMILSLVIIVSLFQYSVSADTTDVVGGDTIQIVQTPAPSETPLEVLVPDQTEVIEPTPTTTINTTSESTSSETATSESTSSETATSESTSSETVTSESTSSETVTSESTSSETVTSESTSSETVTSESTSSETVTSESTSSETVTSESTSSESVTSEITNSQEDRLSLFSQFSLLVEPEEEPGKIVMKYLLVNSDGQYIDQHGNTTNSWGGAINETSASLVQSELFKNSMGSSELEPDVTYTVTPKAPNGYSLHTQTASSQTISVSSGEVKEVIFKVYIPNKGNIILEYKLVDADGNYLDSSLSNTNQAGAEIVKTEYFSYNGSTELDMQTYIVNPVAPIGFSVYPDDAVSVTVEISESKLNEVLQIRVVANADGLFKVQYFANYEGIEDSKTVHFGEGAVADGCPFKGVEGYSFSHWSTSPDGIGGTKYDIGSTLPSENIDLYAQWTQDKYSISYYTNYPAVFGWAEKNHIDNNNGNGYIFGHAEEIIAPEFMFEIPEGKRFAGWGLDRNGFGTDYYSVGKVINSLTGNLSLYAIWRDSYNMNANLEGIAYTGVYDGEDYNALKSIPKFTRENSYPTQNINPNLSYSIDGGEFQSEIPVISEAGSYEITIRAQLDEYNTYQTSVTAVIQKADLIITAEDKTMLPHEEIPTLTYDFGDEDGNGVPVLGEEDGIRNELKGELFKVDNDAEIAPGEYDIIALPDNKLEISNYNISYGNAILDVGEYIDLTFAVKDYIEEYNSEDHKTFIKENISVEQAGTTFEYSIDGGFNYLKEIPETINANSFELTVKATNPKYKEAIKVMNVTINKVDLKVVVGTYEKYKDDKDPTFTATFTGLKGEDKITYDISRDSGEEIKSYDLKITVDNNDNYNITTENGELIIKERPVTVNPEPTPTPTPLPTPTPIPAETPEPEESLAPSPVPEVTQTPQATISPTQTPQVGTTLPPTGTNVPDNVKVDDTEIGEDDYTITEDGRLELSEEYLGTLPDGEYTITIEMDGDVFETTVIVDGGVPLSSGEFEKVYGWSLVNLILTIIAGLLAIYFIIKKRDSEDDALDEEERNELKKVKIILIVLAVINIILLLLTQNFLLPMGIIDVYTIAFVVLAIIGLIVAFKNKGDNEETNDAKVS